jgi:hypothetical protein
MARSSGRQWPGIAAVLAAELARRECRVGLVESDPSRSQMRA